MFCLFIALLFIFPSIGEAAGQVKNAVDIANETENFKKVQSLISDGTIYDIGLFTDPNTAISWMRAYYPSFNELCEDSFTIESLRKMIEAEKENTLQKILLEEWLHCLIHDTETAEGVRVASYYWKDDIVGYTIVLPSGKTIPAEKYIGSRTPPRYPTIQTILQS